MGCFNLSNRQLAVFVLILVATMSFSLTAYHVPVGTAAYFPWRTISEPHAAMPERHGASANARTHIYFLKTHKCASTTVQRILMLYAIRNNLSVALPLRESNNFFPLYFQPEVAKRTCSHPNFDVVAAHTRFHPSARSYMPHDTFFVSVVRDPAEQMESTFYYFLVKYCEASRFAKQTFERYMQQLIQMPPKSRLPPVRYPCGVDYMQFIQLYDFGLELDPRPTREIVQQKIAQLDSDFDLVLVVERMDESLIILRDMLGWSTEDMLHLKSNFRVNASSHLSAEVRAAAYAWNWGDKMLYDHFRAKMDAMIERRKDYLRTEVRRFRELQAAFYGNCVSNDAVETANVGKGAKARPPVLMSSYQLNDWGQANDRCRMAAMPEWDLFSMMNRMYITCPQTVTPTASASTVVSTNAASAPASATSISRYPKR